MKKKTTIKTGYKAIYPRCIYSNSNGEYSLCSWSSPSRIEYKYNTWTNRPTDCGPLAVFNSKSLALAFVKKHSLYALRHHEYVFKCKYVPSKDKTLWDRHHILPDNEIPKGTIFADKVRLIR